jgi:hypothetical protein
VIYPAYNKRGSGHRRKLKNYLMNENENVWKKCFIDKFRTVPIIGSFIHACRCMSKRIHVNIKTMFENHQRSNKKY